MPASACAPGCRQDATWWPVGLKKAPSLSWLLGRAMIGSSRRESSPARRPRASGANSAFAGDFLCDAQSERGLDQAADVAGVRAAIEAADGGARRIESGDRLVR